MESEFKLKENSLLSIPLPPRLKGFQKLKRHIVQLLRVLFTRDYASYQALHDLSKKNYQSDSGTKFWKQIARNGLETYEEKSLEVLDKNVKSILVFGCGAGREAFGLEKIGFEVDAYDYSEEMINFAKSINAESRVSFYKELPDKKYDVIFVTNVLLNIIPGKKLRDEFLNQLKLLCHKNTKCLFFINCEEINPGHRFYWISFLMRIKSLFGLGPWEKGDFVSAWMANWKDDPTPLFYHYFSSELQIESLFQKHEYQAKKHWGIFWEVSPMSDTENSALS